MKRISELLKEKRIEKKLSLDDVEKAIKIKKIYLEAIEDGKFHVLPSESYAKGFVKNYALFLGVPEYKVIPMFRREYEAEKIDFVPRFRKNQHRFSRRTLYSPRALVILIACMIIAGFVAFQYSPLFLSPKLEITRPVSGENIDSNVIQVLGESDPQATVLVNGEDVYVGLDGKFRKSIYAFTGDETITVIAKNRFGKETTKTVTVTVK